jgi:hypothetical protein
MRNHPNLTKDIIQFHQFLIHGKAQILPIFRDKGKDKEKKRKKKF